MSRTESYNKEELQKNLDQKIANFFKGENAYVEYMGETLKSFAFRYLPSHESARMEIFRENANLFGVESFENNMGNAFKIKDLDIKNGIKQLAKSVPMSEKPEVRFRIGVNIREISGERGSVDLISEVHWGFPHFNDQNKKQKKLLFKFENVHEFRKNLALRLEDVAELFN